MARLSDEAIQQRFQENLARTHISDEEALERWPELPASERDRRRHLAELQRARHATVVDDETGQRMLGGYQPASQNTLRKSAMETIAELADGDRQKEVVDALFAPLAKTESAAVRGKGAREIVKIAAEHREVERRDREELAKLGKEELIAKLVTGILGGEMAGDLMSALQKAKTGLPSAPVTPSTAYDADGTAEAA